MRAAVLVVPADGGPADSGSCSCSPARSIFWRGAISRRSAGCKRCALYSIPLPWIAAELGWFVAEYGRQPWVISEVLPTSLGVSTLSKQDLYFSLAGFVGFYTLLLVVELYLMFKYARLGPSSLGTGDVSPRAGEAAMIFDYETLKVIWWLLIGVLLIGFAVTDGFDMGIGMLLPFLGRTDGERRVIINSVGATWEGNQTWLITAAGATFAAWPLVYAVSFSGMYVAMLLVLFALFFRPVGFDYRSKLRRSALARGVGLGTLRRQLRAGARVRRRVRQPAAGRPVPFRRQHALVSTRARSGRCSIRSRCWRVWSALRCWCSTARSTSRSAPPARSMRARCGRRCGRRPS